MTSLESQQYDDVSAELEGFMTVQKKVMFYTGVWSVDNEPHNMLYYWRRYSQQAMFCYMSTLLVGQQVVDLILIRDNLLFALEEIISISIFTYGLGVVWTITTRRDDLKEMILILQEMNRAERLTDDFQRSLVQKTEKVINYTALLGSYSTLACIPAAAVAYNVMVSLGIQLPREPLYRSYFPYDVTVSPYYELTILSQGLNVILFYICLMLYDFIVVTVFLHTIIQFKLLRHRLQNLRNNAKRNVWLKDKVRAINVKKFRHSNGNEKSDVGTKLLNKVDSEMRRLLEECMGHHEQLLRLIHLVMDVSYHKLSLLAAWNLTGIIIFAIYVDLAPGFDPKQFIYMDLMTLSCFELLMFSFLSTQLSHESSLVGEALYSCDWSDSPEDFKRDMRIFMTTVNKPVEILILKFVPLSLDTWLSIMNTAYSYYTVMNEVAK